MSRRSTKYLKAALSALHYTGADGLFGSVTRGTGAILTLHQVGPEVPQAFSPNRILKITPYFLERTIQQTLEAGFDCVSLDEVAERLKSPEAYARPFVAFTLDDAYRDNITYAAPVFRRYGIPFAIYAPTDYLDGNGDLWWLALELAIAQLDRVALAIGAETFDLACATLLEKEQAFHTLYWVLRGVDETVARAAVAELCVGVGIDQKALCRDLIMTWDELKALARDPLVTIGGHTVRHYALAKLGAGAARYEMVAGIERLSAALGQPIRHFSYPFGDRDSAGDREFDIARSLGLATAVTTRKGLIRDGSTSDPMALPRLSLNGDYQDPLYTKVLLSGLPFAILDLARRVMPKSNASAKPLQV
ncbi:MAG: polysaccharide deacetylase family protein [Hyphomicrobiaceae bacterium]|nr:polysaccharide deacetylase family protein [Hyphomicrobiaceae bacterium]